MRDTGKSVVLGQQFHGPENLASAHRKPVESTPVVLAMQDGETRPITRRGPPWPALTGISGGSYSGLLGPTQIAQRLEWVRSWVVRADAELRE